MIPATVELYLGEKSPDLDPTLEEELASKIKKYSYFQDYLISREPLPDPSTFDQSYTLYSEEKESIKNLFEQWREPDQLEELENESLEENLFLKMEGLIGIRKILENYWQIEIIKDQLKNSRIMEIVIQIIRSFQKDKATEQSLRILYLLTREPIHHIEPLLDILPTICLSLCAQSDSIAALSLHVLCNLAYYSPLCCTLIIKDKSFLSLAFSQNRIKQLKIPMTLTWMVCQLSKSSLQQDEVVVLVRFLSGIFLNADVQDIDRSSIYLVALQALTNISQKNSSIMLKIFRQWKVQNLFEHVVQMTHSNDVLALASNLIFFHIQKGPQFELRVGHHYSSLIIKLLSNPNPQIKINGARNLTLLLEQNPQFLTILINSNIQLSDSIISLLDCNSHQCEQMFMRVANKLEGEDKERFMEQAIKHKLVHKYFSFLNKRQYDNTLDKILEMLKVIKQTSLKSESDKQRDVAIQQLGLLNPVLIKIKEYPQYSEKVGEILELIKSMGSQGKGQQEIRLFTWLFESQSD